MFHVKHRANKSSSTAEIIPRRRLVSRETILTGSGPGQRTMIGRYLPIRRLLSANGRPIPNRGPPNVSPGIRGPSMLAMMSTPERERSPTSATDKVAALALTPVSRQIEARLDAYVDLLVQWQTQNQSRRAFDAAVSSGRATSRIPSASNAGAECKTLGRFRQRRRLSGCRACLRACGVKARASICRAQRQEGGISPRGRSGHRRAGHYSPDGYRGLCGQIGGSDRLRDRACAGAATSAARLRRTSSDNGAPRRCFSRAKM